MTDNERKKLLLKAKPILFNADMVRAILDGRKTVTRRVLKNQDSSAFDYDYNYDTDGVARSVDLICDNGNNGLWAMTNKTPYYPNDILYVRETWSPVSVKPKRYLYKTHCPEADNLPVKWHSSIHMPKEAARIFLRVTNIKVERLQDISDDDCMAEGICSWTKDGKLYKYYLADEEGDYPACNWSECPKTSQAAMQCVWNSTIKKSNLDKYGWDANPFVWVIEFERID